MCSVSVTVREKTKQNNMTSLQLHYLLLGNAGRQKRWMVCKERKEQNWRVLTLEFSWKPTQIILQKKLFFLILLHHFYFSFSFSIFKQQNIRYMHVYYPLESCLKIQSFCIEETLFERCALDEQRTDKKRSPHDRETCQRWRRSSFRKAVVDDQLLVRDGWGLRSARSVGVREIWNKWSS